MEVGCRNERPTQFDVSPLNFTHIEKPLFACRRSISCFTECVKPAYSRANSY